MIKLKASQLRTTVPSKKHLVEIQKSRKEIYLVLDSVLDTYNVGGIFRLADAVGAKKVILCGETETPPNPRIKKASINTTEWVDWEYEENTIKAIENLRNKVPNIQIIAIEQDEKSIPYKEVEYREPVAFIVGNETLGISKEVLGLSDYVVEIPMFGVNTSLNVIISLGIVLYNSKLN